MHKPALIALILAIPLLGCNRETASEAAVTTAAHDMSNMPSLPANAMPMPASDTAMPTMSMPMTNTAPLTADAIPNRVAKPASGKSKLELAASIADPGMVADNIRDVYEKAKLVADRLDQMYCYCKCHENMGHVSLLTCFQGDHAAECGICLNEGYQVWMDWNNNLPVEQSQRTADNQYNQGNPPPHRPGKDSR